MYRLENWSVVCLANNPYMAPELRTSHLSGQIYGRRPEFLDGEIVTTSYIVKAEGNKITTFSGSVYILGTPSQDYIEWARKNYPNFDEWDQRSIIVREHTL